MARGLGARITLMVAQVVPYPLPLTAPDVPAKFTERIAESIAVDDTTVEIYLCRDRNEALRRALPPGSLVIVGAHDPATPPAAGEEIARQIKGAKLVSLDAAHISNVEQPAAFAKAVVDFLKA
jgi:pimeloyl-ACP methyl ester carboxylesterase